MRFFFYGTLLDGDVTALVLGRRLPPRRFAPAVLPGHARWRVQGGSYPIAVPDRRAEVPGAVVEGLSARDVARLAAYEGPGYRIATLKVKVRGALAIVPVFEPLGGRLTPTNRPWDIVSWQRRDKRAFLDRLKRAFSARRRPTP